MLKFCTFLLKITAVMGRLFISYLENLLGFKYWWDCKENIENIGNVISYVYNFVVNWVSKIFTRIVILKKDISIRESLLCLCIHEETGYRGKGL